MPRCRQSVEMCPTDQTSVRWLRTMKKALKLYFFLRLLSRRRRSVATTRLQVWNTVKKKKEWRRSSSLWRTPGLRGWGVVKQKKEKREIDWKMNKAKKKKKNSAAVGEDWAARFKSRCPVVVAAATTKMAHVLCAAKKRKRERERERSYFIIVATSQTDGRTANGWRFFLIFLTAVFTTAWLLLHHLLLLLLLLFIFLYRCNWTRNVSIRDRHTSIVKGYSPSSFWQQQKNYWARTK